MSKLVNIIGAGGHTRSLISLIEHIGFEIQGIYDDTYDPRESEIINGYPVLGKIDKIKEGTIVLSFGDCMKRYKMFGRFQGRILTDNLIHPTAYIDKYADLGSFNQVFAGAIVNSNTKIGSNNIINTGAIIEHEVKVGNHNHISVGANVCGRVKIGSWCYIGAGSTIIDKLSVTDYVIIGANTVVIRDITEAGTYVGNPARRVK